MTIIVNCRLHLTVQNEGVWLQETGKIHIHFYCLYCNLLTNHVIVLCSACFPFCIAKTKKSRNVNMWTISSGKTVHIMTTCSTTCDLCYERMPKCCGGWDYSTETHYNTFWSTWHKQLIMKKTAVNCT